MQSVVNSGQQIKRPNKGTFMKTIISCTLIVLSMIVVSLAEEKPPLQIVRNGDALILIMPAEVSAAISKVAPDFSPWQLKDYLPRVQEEFGKIQKGVAPFAIIVDINHDGLKDLVVEGHTPKEAFTIAVLSTRNGYVAHILNKWGKVNPIDTKDVDEKGKVSSGLNSYLDINKYTRSKKSTYIFEIIYIQIQTPDGGLSDPAVIEYYLKNGKFIKKTING